MLSIAKSVALHAIASVCLPLLVTLGLFQFDAGIIRTGGPLLPIFGFFMAAICSGYGLAMLHVALDLNDSTLLLPIIMIVTANDMLHPLSGNPELLLFPEIISMTVVLGYILALMVERMWRAPSNRGEGETNSPTA